MKFLGKYLRYDWPMHFILLATNWFPDNVIFLRFRGWLAKSFVGRCGKDLRLGRSLDIYNPSNIFVGDHVYFAYGCVILAVDEINVDNEVMFGPYCVLSSSNHSNQNGSYRFGTSKLAPINIGKGSWIGAHSVITAGSRIGSGSVIAAGAVVSGNIPDGVLAGGVPARVIKALDD